MSGWCDALIALRRYCSPFEPRDPVLMDLRDMQKASSGLGNLTGVALDPIDFADRAISSTV